MNYMKNSLSLFCALTLLWTLGFAQQRTDSVHVAHYDLTLSVVDFTNHVVEGRTELTVVAKVNNLHQLRLDLMGLTTDSVKVNEQTANFSHVGEDIFIDVPTMQSGDTAQVRVFYHGVPPHDISFGGFYFNGEYAYNVGVALYDQPHAYGRCWFPCMDEFTDKSTYNFHIRTQNGKRAVCNGLLTDSTTLADGTRVWDWALNLPVPTYLVSMAVGDYLCHADTFHGMNGEIPIAIYTAPNIYPNIPASFVHLKSVLRKYEEFFGPYRWPRVGYVCVGMTGGAMEHATNIALPNVAVNGNLMYEGTIMHELFHHWFGDLITCERAEEMWINEGFADYAESLVLGWLYSTESSDEYLKNIRSIHDNTLQTIVSSDEGLYALDNVPQEHTYGMHSYQKGGLVIHSLRTYMGDSLFFSSLRQLLDQYAYQNINSHEFFTYLTQVSGMNLMHFYEDWIHQPGFADFDIDRIVPLSCGNYEVTVRQKGYGTEHLYTDVPVEVTFVSADREFYTAESQLVSGDSTNLMFLVPFQPAFAIANYNDKLSDATIDFTGIVATPEEITCGETKCYATIEQMSDTALIRVEHHFVAPSAPSPLPDGYHKFSTTHYWTVHSTSGIVNGHWTFRVARSNNQHDYELFADGDTYDNLKLMYRPDADAEWTPIPYNRTGSPYNALISTHEMLSGQYCFAMADEEVSIPSLNRVKMSVSPNPATHTLTLRTQSDMVDKAIIFDSVGHKIRTVKVSGDVQDININNLQSGNYIIVLYKKGQSVARTQFIKS